MQTSNEYINATMHPVLKFITEPKYHWLRHTLFIVVCLVLAFKGDVGTKENIDSIARRSILIMDAIMFTVVMSLLYVVILVLIPRLLFRSKLLLFFIWAFLIALLIYVMSYLLELYFLKPYFP